MPENGAKRCFKENGIFWKIEAWERLKRTISYISTKEKFPKFCFQTKNSIYHVTISYLGSYLNNFPETNPFSGSGLFPEND